MRTTRLRVRLQDVHPPVERVVDVPAASTLPELHLVLQAAMGWANVHLHAFDVAGTRYLPPDPDGPMDDLDETGVKLRALGDRFVYEYDFGDGWSHDVEVLGTGGAEPGCVGGQGGCPLEDSGGPSGFARLQEVLADPDHPERANAVAWASGPPPSFDLTDTDRLVRRVIGAVPESVRLLLGLLEGGVELTPGGRLPQKIVRAVQEQRPDWAFSEKPAGREDDMPALAVLHGVLRETKVVRVQHGVLTPTRAASDDLEVLRRLRAWFVTDDEFFNRLVVAIEANVLADGPLTSTDLAVCVLDLVGHGWFVDGHPVTVDDVRMECARTSRVLQALDQVVVELGRWSVGPAVPLLPAAVGIAGAWGEDSTQAHYRALR